MTQDTAKLDLLSSLDSLDPAPAARRVVIARDWWSKTFAGLVLGFLLSLALVGIFAWIGPGGINAPEKNQFVMWMITPLWMLILSFIYLCRSGLRAISYLLIANALAYTVFFIVCT
ncbi:hypothetical protein [Undibacterium danionis]|uniref:Iron ABC transporter permease n=1 Tax=Undibacterium danionis TaxID=1812100 RepID=A0ABV6IEU4_9BURK